MRRILRQSEFFGGDRTVKKAWGYLRVPLGIATVLALIYVTEIVLAGSIRYGAAYAYITSLPDQYDIFLRVIAPFLHSNHEHIAYNIGFLLVLSPLVLSHEREANFLVVFLMACWFTASVIPWALGGAIGFGISGGNAALAGWETVYRVRSMIVASQAMDTILHVPYWKEGVLVLIPAVLTLTNIGQAFGFLPVPGGASVAGHLSGAVFGMVFGAVWVFADRITGQIDGNA